MQMLGGGMILCGCMGLGLWYRRQFLLRLHITRELICLLDQWISEIRYNRSSLPEGCRQIGRQREDRLGIICTGVYREYTEAGGTGFLEIAGESFRRQLEALIRAMELSRQGLERTAAAQQQEITQKCRLAVGLGGMSGMFLVLLLL